MTHWAFGGRVIFGALVEFMLDWTSLYIHVFALDLLVWAIINPDRVLRSSLLFYLR